VSRFYVLTFLFERFLARWYKLIKMWDSCPGGLYYYRRCDTAMTFASQVHKNALISTFNVRFR